MGRSQFIFRRARPLRTGQLAAGSERHYLHGHAAVLAKGAAAAIDSPPERWHVEAAGC